MVSAWTFGILFALSASDADSTEQFAPTESNVEITQDARIKPGVYRIADPECKGALRIVGDDITVDFQGAHVLGKREVLFHTSWEEILR